MDFQKKRILDKTNGILGAQPRPLAFLQRIQHAHPVFPRRVCSIPPILPVVS